MPWDATPLGALSVLAACAAIGCSGGPASPGAPDARRPGEPVERPQGPLNLQQAREYALALINRDRAAEGLEPVEWDETAARAGQRHADDMAAHGFTAHWGSDGSVPEQRYTEAGGIHFVQENAACFFDAKERELDPDPIFDPELIEKLELAFIDEKPPRDGHRKNILKPVHNKVGVGLSKTVGIAQPCMAQEFVDEYGEYAELPKTARVGQTLRVAGEVAAPVKFGGVGIGRIEAAAPIPAAELNTTSVYKVPEPYVLFFPKGFKTPKPVQVDGSSFEIDVPLDDGGRKGRYEISVWGGYPGSGKELVMISLRTVIVR